MTLPIPLSPTTQIHQPRFLQPLRSLRYPPPLPSFFFASQHLRTLFVIFCFVLFRFFMVLSGRHASSRSPSESSSQTSSFVNSLKRRVVCAMRRDKTTMDTPPSISASSDEDYTLCDSPAATSQGTPTHTPPAAADFHFPTDFDDYLYKFTESVHSISICENAQFCAVTLYENAEGGRVGLWNITTQKLCFILRHREGYEFATEAQIPKGSNYIITNGLRRVNVWCLLSGRHLHTLRSRASIFYVCPSGKNIFCGQPGKVHQYRVGCWGFVGRHEVHSSLCSSPCGRYLVSSGKASAGCVGRTARARSSLKLISLATGRIVEEEVFASVNDAPFGMVISPCSQWLISTSLRESCIQISDLATLTLLRSLPGVWCNVDRLAVGGPTYAPRILAKSTSSQDPVQVWDLSSGSYLGEVCSSEQIGASFILSPCGQTILYDVSGGWRIRTLETKMSGLYERVKGHEYVL